MKNLPIVALLCIAFTGCASLTSIQNSPATQAAENAAIGIGLELATGSPAFGFVAPLAVNSLTALANKSNPIAVTGNPTADAAKIIQAVSTSIPNSAGKTAAVKIANAYVLAMSQSSVSQTPAGANSVLGAIASGLNTGAILAQK